MVARAAAWRAAGAASVSVLEATRPGGWASLAASGHVPGLDTEKETLLRSKPWVRQVRGAGKRSGSVRLALPSWTKHEFESSG